MTTQDTTPGFDEVTEIYVNHYPHHDPDAPDHEWCAVCGLVWPCTTHQLAVARCDLTEVTADRDRLAGIVRQIDAYCQPIADTDRPGDTRWEWEAMQTVAGAVIDIIEGE